ncbi:MAG: formylglycine-generating enzyme family protein, partial [Nannocystis sp.]|nr:formylglycine-generating enzyme family protein [Nannocystis sp.]
AAWAIARRSDWWREIERRLDDPQWDKVVDLFSGCVFEAGGRDRVDDLIEKILDRGEGEGLRREAETLVHLERVLAPMDAYEYREEPALVIRQKALAERVMAIFTKEGALQVPVKTRIAAAEVIGRWGDPRLAEGLDNFIEIPGTELSLGKFPVTVVEYGRFIAASGYQNSRYWDKDGAAWRTKHKRLSSWEWEDQQEHPNRPVVGVSWHEARAYCRWLSEGLDGGGRARLPTAAEWEHAATPKTGEYPWGTDQDAGNKQLSDEDLAEQFANFKNSLGAPSPVGVYPAGAGPHGHLDLAGNVWEWCEDGDAKDRRWITGGSYYDDNRGALAAAYRAWGWSGLGNFDIGGFRVVVAREPD